MSEKQIDASRWYMFGMSNFGNHNLRDAVRCCWHAIQSDTTIDVSKYYFNMSDGLAAQVQANAKKMQEQGQTKQIANNNNNNNNNSVSNKITNKAKIAYYLKHHFCLSACLLACRCCLIMNDYKQALNYARASVRLSLDNEFLKFCNNYQTLPRVSMNLLCVDQRSVAYTLFCVACTQQAYHSLVFLFFFCFVLFFVFVFV